MAEWIQTGEHFIEADVIRWKEGVFLPRRGKGRAAKLGDRVVTAEVLQEDAEWVHLLVRHCDLCSVKRGRLEREVPLLNRGEEIKRKRATIVRSKPERLTWSDESARALLASSFLGNRSPLPPKPGRGPLTFS
tara:strand:+ start:22 stop:420 length:399 start_codon:yes stop_codon:yes gene_type:complete